MFARIVEAEIGNANVTGDTAGIDDPTVTRRECVGGPPTQPDYP
jgi:hypothetical protein